MNKEIEEYLKYLNEFSNEISDILITIYLKDTKDELVDQIKDYCKSINININENELSNKTKSEIQLGIVSYNYDINKKIKFFIDRVYETKNNSLSIFENWDHSRHDIRKIAVSNNAIKLLCQRWVEEQLIIGGANKQQIQSAMKITDNYFSQINTVVNAKCAPIFNRNDLLYNNLMNSFHSSNNMNSQTNQIQQTKSYVKTLTNDHNLLSNE